MSRRISRRDFVKVGALLGGATAVMLSVPEAFRKYAEAVRAAAQGGENPLAKPESIIYSVCLQCHTACPIKGKILDGVLVKLTGNPYSPQNMTPHIPYKTRLDVAAKIDAYLCVKGQSGIESLYDPYRVIKVLKRAGPRGSNKWKTIPFDQAIKEIVEGGRLFSDVPGEEDRQVPGLKDIWVWGLIRDRGGDPASISADMKSDISKIMAASGDEKARLVEEFKAKWSGELAKYGLKLEDVFIDPDHPDLGTKANQFVFMAGRIEHGRKEFSKRFVIDAFGSINWYEHTTICEQSHHIAYGMISGKHHMKPDILNCEFIIFFGTGAFEANFGPTNMAHKLTKAVVEGGLKFAVVDPRLSKTAAKAWRWVPIKPGTDGAFALGMIRWILENKRYDARYLENANKAAADLDGEPTFTNATYLVKVEDGKLLRASELGIGSDSEYVIMDKETGEPTPVDPNDAENPKEGILLVDTTLNGIRVKSGFQLLYESAMSRSLDEWASICGVSREDIEVLAAEFTSHGKRAVAELYRGPVQHPNGYYNGQAIITLNLLIGNIGWKGGLSKGGGHWHETGSKRKGPFHLSSLHPGKISGFGVKLTREKSKFESSTLSLVEDVPKRPWYPFTSNLYQEILPSAADGYPYRIKILWIHKGTPGFATPAADAQLEILKDVEKVPLIIATDIVLGETTIYADYVFPDIAIWERWGTPHTSPDVNTKASKVRQPMVAPLVDTCRVFGEEMPISMEAIMLAIAEKLGLPGYGSDGFGPGMPFTRMEDYYLKMVANIAAGDKVGDEVPDADDEELRIFREARKHLPKTVFDEERWHRAVIDPEGNDWWRKVVYVLNRGGRFEDADKAYDGEYLTHRFTGLLNLYVEKVGSYYSKYMGVRFSGVPVYVPPYIDSKGRPIRDDEYPLILITYKEIYGGQSRTPGNYWILSVMPENHILINKKTAEELGLKDGDVVRIVSASNPDGVWPLGDGPYIKNRYVEGKVKVTGGIAPGVVAVSWHYGHFGYGASDCEIDGVVIKGDYRRGLGLCPNAVMRRDPVLGNVCLTDPIGGSASFFDTRVKLVKVS